MCRRLYLIMNLFFWFDMSVIGVDGLSGVEDDMIRGVACEGRDGARSRIFCVWGFDKMWLGI